MALRHVGLEQAELAVRLRRRELDQRERADEPAREPLPGDREVEDGPLGRRAVQGVDGHGHLAHRVAFDPRRAGLVRHASIVASGAVVG